jgi:cardiolipin synthase
VIAELWNVPNVISLIRLALIPVFLWLGVNGEYGWSGVLLGVIGSTDWIDGFLARRLNQVTEVGKFLDPLADRLAVFVAVIAGLIWDVLPAGFAIALIVREVLIGLGAMYGWSRGVTKLDVRWLGKAATLLLYLSISFFYIGVGFDVDAVIVVAWLTGVPGIVMYYWVGVEYLFDMKRAIAHAR